MVLKMLKNIKCDCGNIFKGIQYKEDTCPKCLKKLINPTKKEFEINYVENDFPDQAIFIKAFDLNHARKIFRKYHPIAEIIFIDKI